ncbi:MAG: metal ABC transporter permease [Verrucomicrobia bacterium]|nr:metal ABC transporter permease [Verrucomicrobiota bacterium]
MSRRITIIMFTEAFMWRGLLAAILLGPLCALLGVFVTARRMAFFSDTISHAALAGIALGFWFGMADPTLPLIGFSLLVALLLLWLKENTELLTDTIMALLLSGSVATGIIILSLLKGFRRQIDTYLFGNILAIGPQEIWLATGLFVVVGAGIFLNLSALTLLTAQEELAHVCGVPVRRDNYLFVIVLTLVVAVSIRLLGIILVTSLIVIPPAAARNVSRNLRQQIWFSVAFGLLGGFSGTLASNEWDIPCGPAIVLACIGLFLITMMIGFVRASQSSKQLQP